MKLLFNDGYDGDYYNYYKPGYLIDIENYHTTESTLKRIGNLNMWSANGSQDDPNIYVVDSDIELYIKELVLENGDYKNKTSIVLGESDNNRKLYANKHHSQYFTIYEDLDHTTISDSTGNIILYNN